MAEALPERDTVPDMLAITMGRSTDPGHPLGIRDRLSVRYARRTGRRTALGWGLAEAYGDTLELLIGELVANAFEHGRGNVTLRLRREARHVRVDVTDGLAKARLTTSADGALAESGRGLFLVDSLAESWGVTPDGFGVWCLVAVAGPGDTRHDALHIRELNHDR
ncbi:ATP-binding protein [Streptomyces sp. NPDC003691]